MRRITRSTLLSTLVGLTLLAGTTACGGSDGSASPATTDAPATTAAPTTAPATTLAPISLPSTIAPVATDAPAATVPYIDATTVLNPWDTQQLIPMTEADAATLVAQATADPASVSQLKVIGAAQAVDPATGDGSVLVFAEFNAALSADEAQQFESGVIGEATDTTEIDAHGLPGYLFSSNGSYGFVSMRPTTGVVIFSPSPDALQLSIDGLFSANPDL